MCCWCVEKMGVASQTTDWLKLRKRWGRTGKEKSRKERQNVNVKSCLDSSMWIPCGAQSFSHCWAWTFCYESDCQLKYETTTSCTNQSKCLWLTERVGTFLLACSSIKLWVLNTACFKCLKEKCITVNIVHHMSHSTECVVCVQLIYMLRYSRHRQQQYVRALIPLWTCTNAWMLALTQTQTKRCRVIFLFWHQGVGAISFSSALSKDLNQIIGCNIF